MPSVEVEVYCAECNAGLCNQTESVQTRSRGMPAFLVVPCDRCLERARDEGRDEGKDEAEDKFRDRIAELENEIESLQQQVES